jgi:P-type Cu2+ transporter
MATQQTTAVLEVAGVHWASEKATVERVLGRRPGVLGIEANPVGQTATVTYDPARTSVADLAAWIRDCGYHCAGQSVPQHVCDPEAEPRPHGPAGHHRGPGSFRPRGEANRLRSHHVGSHDHRPGVRRCS